MKRVLVIGSCGAGKSTFASRLASVTGLPLIHLDAQYWRPGWKEPAKAEWEGEVRKLLQGEAWIIDGNYGGTMDMRLAACDTAIFLDMPRLLCTWRVIARTFKYWRTPRPDIAPGCPERVNLEYLKFLHWTWTYPARSRPPVLRRLDHVRDRIRVVRLTSTHEMNSFIDDLYAS